MYPVIPIGPLSLPTGPILALAAVWVGLDIMGRYGRRWGLHSDDLFNLSLMGLAAGLLVARLWSVVEFWPVYAAEPLLILSLRPGGFRFWPGLITALSIAYAYLWRRALPPAPVAACAAVAAAAGGVLLSVSAYLTGALVGMPTSVPWALPYFGELRHPVALYQAVGLLLLLLALWWLPTQMPAGRVTWWAVLGYSTLRLVVDAFQADAAVTLAGLRSSQMVALGVALFCMLMLARQPRPDRSQDPG